MSIGPAPQPSEDPVFHQYKLLVDDSARFSDRRQTTNNYYVTANSILLGGIGLLLEQNAIRSLLGTSIAVIVAVAGFAVCSAWR